MNENTEDKIENELGEIIIDTVELKRRPVTIAGKKFTLVELDGEARDKHLTRTAKRMRYSPEGQAIGMDDMTDFQAELIAQSLRDEEGKAVPLAVIRKWSGSVQERLCVAAQALSGLGKGKLAAVAAAKKD